MTRTALVAKYIQMVVTNWIFSVSAIISEQGRNVALTKSNWSKINLNREIQSYIALVNLSKFWSSGSWTCWL